MCVASDDEWMLNLNIERQQSPMHSKKYETVCNEKICETDYVDHMTR